jgi:hypothetical protein
MEHQPFEDWLLADQPLTPEKKRELQSHLRECSQCSALAEVNLSLRAAKLATPQAGFTSRWQSRLATQRKSQRRRQFIGSVILVIGGVALLGWVTAPIMGPFMLAPAAWITSWITYLVYLLSSLQTLGELGAVLLHIIPDFIPPFAWMILGSTISGLFLLWTVSIWKITRVPQGVHNEDIA